MKFGLEENIIEKITRVLEEQPKVDKACIFGSRAKGNYRPDSDIDIAVKGYDLTVEDILKLSAAIEKLGLSLEIDLVDCGAIKDEALLEHIGRVGVLFYDIRTDYRIEDLAIFLNEKRIPLSSMERSKKKGIYPYYGASGIVDYIDEFIYNGEYLLISEDGENLKTRQTPIAFIANGKFWVNNHAHIVKGLKPFTNKLLVYYFKNLDLNPYLTGAVQPKLNKATLSAIPIRIPRRESDQISIVNTLSSLDDKIDLLHLQNKTLESMSEALFRQQFIEEAEDDWKEQSLLETIDLVGGGTPKTDNPDYWEGSIKWLSGGDISDNHKGFVTTTEKSISEKGLQNSSAKLIPKFATIISARGTVGKYCLLSEPMAFSQSNYGILPKYSNCFFFTYLLIGHAVEELQAAAYGSVFDTITTSTFKGYQISLPETNNIKQFEDQVSIFFEKILSNTLQISSLVNLRETLLPKLFSGEARIKMP